MTSTNGPATVELWPEEIFIKLFNDPVTWTSCVVDEFELGEAVPEEICPGKFLELAWVSTTLAPGAGFPDWMGASVNRVSVRGA
jgi:hypothetical protein